MKKIQDKVGIPPDQLPVEKMMYLTRILYKSSSCDKWAEHELDYTNQNWEMRTDQGIL